MLGPYQEDVKCLSRDLIEYGGRKQADTRSHVRTLRRLEAVFFWGGDQVVLNHYLQYHRGCGKISQSRTPSSNLSGDKRKS